MSVTGERAAGADDAELAEFGYKQELDRSLGAFATFAAGISYISILTGTFQLFYFGFAFGGPAYWWSWPMVFAGQLMVALCFAELASRYPIAGSIYNWSKRLGSPHVAWLAGWMMLTASIVTIAAVALAYQLTLPQISDFFQFYGDGTGKYDFAANAVILGTVLIVFTTVINAHRRQADGADQQHGRVHRARGRGAADPGLLFNASRGPGVVLRDAGPRRGLGARLPRRLPRRLARLGLRHVRLRHRELARGGVARPAAQRAARDPARARRLVRHRRAHPAVRDDGGRRHQRRAS